MNLQHRLGAFLALALVTLVASSRGVARATNVTTGQLPDLGVHLDGGTYAYTGAGLQSAINTAGSQIQQGLGGTVYLPDTRNNSIFPTQAIDLGSSTLNMISGVCAKGASNYATWIRYAGRGAAISFPAGTHDTCLQDVYI